MKEKSEEEKVNDICKSIRDSVQQWKEINQSGCNDPFWPDGCNMNLVRNHIIYYQWQLREICMKNNLPLPEEYYFSIPPEVNMHYMANLKQKERVKRIFFQRKIPIKQKYVYDERQMSLY